METTLHTRIGQNDKLQRDGGFRRDARGFSLVELIVVIAIMAVLMTTGLVSMSLVSGQNVKSCVSEAESYLSRTRLEAMSRENAELKLLVKNDGVYVNLSVEGRDVKIGKSGISVSYETTGGTTVDVSGSTELIISYDRSSGAFKPLPGSAEYCERIIFTGSGRTVSLRLVPQTGKYYRE